MTKERVHTYTHKHTHKYTHTQVKYDNMFVTHMNICNYAPFVGKSSFCGVMVRIWVWDQMVLVIDLIQIPVFEHHPGQCSGGVALGLPQVIGSVQLVLSPGADPGFQPPIRDGMAEL